MKTKIKQNKNSSVIRISSFVLALIVLVISISIPSFAYIDTSTNGIDFSEQPVPDILTTNNVYQMATLINSDGLLVADFASGSIRVAVGSGVSDVYCFLVGQNLYLARESSGTYIAGTCKSNSTVAYSYSGSTTKYYDANLYYWNLYIGNITNIYVPVFSTYQDGLLAVRDFIDNPPSGGGSPHPLSLSVPAGNAVYIDVTGVSTVRASLSMTSEVAHPQSWISNQYYGWSTGYPSSISGNPSGSTPIPWSGYGDKTLFNRYKSFSWSLTAVVNSNYLFICNPYASIDEYDQSFNPTIYITLDEAVGYKFYQLTGGIGSDGSIGQQSDGTTATGRYNSDNDTWETTNDETGLPWTPSEGGGNLITTNSINDWLKTIATQISNFFAGAIGAVTTLVGAGSDFIHSLSSLYSWLPSPVYAVLTSALILVITIGVIKVFI